MSSSRPLKFATDLHHTNTFKKEGHINGLALCLLSYPRMIGAENGGRTHNLEEPCPLSVDLACGGEC